MKNKLHLWYTKPALDWETEAMPIGNAHIGGMIFGGVQEERIQYNEKTLWSGGPGIGSEYTFGNKKNAYENLQEIRNILFEGRLDELTNDRKNTLAGIEAGFGKYQSFGEILLKSTEFVDKKITNYSRELDIENAVAKVKFTCEGINYTREYFCSYPDRVMVIKLMSDKEKSLNLEISTICHQDNHDIKVSEDMITIRGNVKDNNMIFESQMQIIAKGGSVCSAQESILVSGADEVVIIIGAATDYKNQYPHYKGEDPHALVSELVKEASKKTYEELKSIHLIDYKTLFDRVKLDLNCQYSNLPTDELVASYTPDNGRELECLVFNYGRYLLISSSRKNTLPANLQGIWNNTNTPPWCGDYHFNINLQMNYWGAEVTNLTECSDSLVDYIESIVVPGRVTAREHFGIEDGGWCVNTMNNPFGYTAVGWWFQWGWAPNSNAFICQNLYEKYAFNRDKEYLRNRIYPIMKEACEFWLKFLIEDKDGTLVSSPSISPEQPRLTVGAVMDQQLVYELFTNTINTSSDLGIDVEFRGLLEETRAKLSKPLIVGKWGQIQEWKEDLDDPNDKHRHISHMTALYPCNQINRKVPEFIKAAKVSINARGDESTGWSMAWKLLMWSRLNEGDRAHKLIHMFLTLIKNTEMNYDTGGGIYSNLLCAHPPFQIDGNCGYVAGVAEMLMHSHNLEIELLPSIPTLWKKGSVSGLIARGAFEISMSWNEGKVEIVTIKSLKGNECKLRFVGLLEKKFKLYKEANDEMVEFKVEDNAISFSTETGNVYIIKK